MRAPIVPRAGRTLLTHTAAAVCVAAVLGWAPVQATPAPSCIGLRSGLVSWWRGENNALDELGSNPGVLGGDARLGPGYIGGGFVLDGLGDGVSVGLAPNLQLQNFTIEAWVKRADTAQASRDPGGAGNGGIFLGSLGGYGFALGGDGRLVLTQIGQSAVYGSHTVTDTQFHHLGVSRNDADVTFYIDGVAEIVAA